jgi:hypothetical protein
MMAVVTASPEYLHGVHRDILTFYNCVGGMTSISAGHNSVPQKMSAIWSPGTLCHSTVLCSVKQTMLLSDDQYQSRNLGNLCAFQFSFCVMLVSFSGLFICSSNLTAVVCTQDMETSSYVFLKLGRA